MADYQAGDVVKLNSGGPKMTCIQKDEYGRWYCEWFSNDKKDGTAFPSTALRQATEKE